MNEANERARWVGLVLATASLMSVAGLAMRPLLVEQNFRFEAWHFAAIAHERGLWVLSYQVQVFGLFLRLGALVGLATLVEKPSDRTLLWPSIAMAASATLVSALAAGHAMHTGFWGADEWTAGRVTASWLDRIRPLDEWMICVSRMSKMFLSFALVPLGMALGGAGLLSRGLARTGSVLGVLAMAALFVWPFSPTAFVPLDLATSGWLAATGATLVLRPQAVGRAPAAAIPSPARQEA